VLDVLLAPRVASGSTDLTLGLAHHVGAGAAADEEPAAPFVGDREVRRAAHPACGQLVGDHVHRVVLGCRLQGGDEPVTKGVIPLRQDGQPTPGDLDPADSGLDPRLHAHSSRVRPSGAGPAPSSRSTTTTVTLSRPPASTAARTRASAPACGSGCSSSMARMSASSTSPVSPSLHSTKRSPGSNGRTQESARWACWVPRDRVTMLRAGCTLASSAVITPA